MDSSSRYFKIRISFCIISVIGLVLNLAAFATVKWTIHDNRDEGLWQISYVHDWQEQFSLWPDHLKTAKLQIAQVFGSIGLAFYIFFVLSSALSIFWTKKWKFARLIKFSVVVFAGLAAFGVIACLAIYKVDRESKNSTLSSSWFLALVSAVIAIVAAPFYFIDALRTIEQKEKTTDKKTINNIPPFEQVQPMRFSQGRSFNDSDEVSNIKSTRPPLLNELKRYRTSFLHPPPKPPKNTVITEKEIESLPLPPSLTKLDLYDKGETEGHPSPAPPPNKTDTDSGISGDDVSRSSKWSSDSQKNEDNGHSVFKFHKTNTIHKYGKTFLKIQNEKADEKLPPVMMIMPGNDVEETEEDKARRSLDLQQQLKLEEEEARTNYNVYFDETKIETITLDNTKINVPGNPKKKVKQTKSEKQKSELQKKRQSEITGAYESTTKKEENKDTKGNKSNKKITNEKSKKSYFKKQNKGESKERLENERNIEEKIGEDDDKGDSDLYKSTEENWGQFAHQDALTIHNVE